MKIAVLIVLGLITSFALAQAQVGSGHALDASLQLGSGGYNSPVRSQGSLYSRNYSPRYSSRQYDYGTNRNYNAYLGERGYNPNTGSKRSGSYPSQKVDARIRG